MIKDRYKGNAFEKWFLPRLTIEEIKNLSKDDALIVLPVGAVEQHGPHLPVYTDTLIGEGLLVKAFDLLNEDENIWLLPPIPYGKSTEHFGMPGTMTLSASTLQAVVMDIAKSVSASGFKRLLLYNTHGGNHDLLNMMARDIRIETGLMVFRLNPGSPEVNGMLSDQEQTYGIHGGEVETSMVLDLKPNWVHMNLSPTEFVNLADSKHVYLKGTSYFAWVMNDISNSGIAGDATKATIDKGEKMNSSVSEYLVEALMEMRQFNIEDVKSQLAKR